jgi:hypothetical protein
MPVISRLRAAAVFKGIPGGWTAAGEIGAWLKAQD